MCSCLGDIQTHRRPELLHLQVMGCQDGSELRVEVAGVEFRPSVGMEGCSGGGATSRGGCRAPRNPQCPLSVLWGPLGAQHPAVTGYQHHGCPIPISTACCEHPHSVLWCQKCHLFKVNPHDLGTNPPRSVLCATTRALSATASFRLHSTPSKPMAADAITHLREQAGWCVPSPRGHPTLWQLPAALLSAKHGTLLTAR